MSRWRLSEGTVDVIAAVLGGIILVGMLLWVWLGGK